MFKVKLKKQASELDSGSDEEEQDIDLRTWDTERCNYLLRAQELHWKCLSISQNSFSLSQGVLMYHTCRT